MRIARFSIDGNVAFGAVEGDQPDELVLDIIKGIPFTDFELSGTKVPLSKVRPRASTPPARSAPGWRPAWTSRRRPT
ncbi:hypothetical protein SGLAM104S_01887 [Streptomyces glaucescens]